MMSSLPLILWAEILCVFVAAVFVTPIAIIQALRGQWAGLHNYARCACWGGAFLLLACFLVVVFA